MGDGPRYKRAIANVACGDHISMRVGVPNSLAPAGFSFAAHDPPPRLSAKRLSFFSSFFANSGNSFGLGARHLRPFPHHFAQRRYLARLARRMERLGAFLRPGLLALDPDGDLQWTISIPPAGQPPDGNKFEELAKRPILSRRH